MSTPKATKVSAARPRVDVVCTHCGHGHRLPASYVGRRVACSACWGHFQVAAVVGDATARVPAPSGKPLAAGAPAGDEWRIGDVLLGLYEVTRIHRAGGMGLVYRVRHRGWNADLAVKTARTEAISDARGRENFQREAENWVALGIHPHVVTCYYVRIIAGRPCVFAEYVDGASLGERIRGGALYAQGEPAALREIFDCAVQFAWGLHHAHEHGLVHQDVKPGNALVGPGGIVKVTDFGLARARAPSDWVGSDESQLVSMGGMTTRYCSPEQRRQDSVSRKTDIWSWAVSVLEMFSGRPRWPTGVEAPDSLPRIAATPPEPGIPKMPPPLHDLLRRCLLLEPGERPANLAVIAEELIGIHRAVFREPYPRLAPRPVEMLADAHSNRALSYLDLGRKTDAVQSVEAALKLDPRHAEAILALAVARHGEPLLAEAQVTRRLREAAGARATRAVTALAHWLLALGELGEAIAAFEVVAGRDGLEQEDSVDLERARSAVRGEHVGLPRFECLAAIEGGEELFAVAWSSARDQVFVGGWEASVRRWDLVRGEPLAALVGHRQAVRAIAVSPEGRILAAAGDDATVRLWDVASGVCLHVLEGHTGPITALAFGAGVLVSGSEDWTTRTWDPLSGVCRDVLEGHHGAVRGVAVDARGGRIASAGDDRTVRVWSGPASEPQVLEGHVGAVRAVALTRDGRRLVSAGDDRIIRLWDVGDGKLLRRLEGHAQGVASVALSRDGLRALSGGADHAVRLWDLRFGLCVRVFAGHRGVVDGVAFGADGTRAVSVSRDRTMRIWAMEGAELLGPPRPILCRPLATEEVSRQGHEFRDRMERARRADQRGDWADAAREVALARTLGGFERDPTALALNARLAARLTRRRLVGAWQQRALEAHFRPVTSVAVDRSGDFVLSGGLDKSLIWCSLSDAHPPVRQDLDDWVYAVALAQDDSLAASAGASGTVRVWRKDGWRQRRMTGHEGAVHALAFAAPELLLSGGADGTIRIWRTRDGKCLRTIEAHVGLLPALGVAADGRLAATGSWDGTVKVWDIGTGRRMAVFDGHAGGVRALCWSPDGQFVFSAGSDQQILQWSRGGGEPVRSFSAPVQGFQALAITADGAWLLSGSGDHMLRIWSVATGECVRTLAGHSAEVSAVAVTPDARFAVTAGGDAVLRVWELDWEIGAAGQE